MKKISIFDFRRIYLFLRSDIQKKRFYKMSVCLCLFGRMCLYILFVSQKNSWNCTLIWTKLHIYVSNIPIILNLKLGIFPLKSFCESNFCAVILLCIIGKCIKLRTELNLTLYVCFRLWIRSRGNLVGPSGKIGIFHRGKNFR